MENNSRYKNLKINSKIFDSLPENGIPVTIQTIETEHINTVESEVLYGSKEVIDD